jgi:hypothetical protein
MGAATDRLDHQRGQRHRADAGVALRSWFEAAAEPAGLVAGGADLKDRDGSVEVDPAPAQSGYRTSPNEVTSRSMVDPLRRKDFGYGVVVTPFDEAL